MYIQWYWNLLIAIDGSKVRTAPSFSWLPHLDFLRSLPKGFPGNVCSESPGHVIPRGLGFIDFLSSDSGVEKYKNIKKHWVNAYKILQNMQNHVIQQKAGRKALLVHLSLLVLLIHPTIALYLLDAKLPGSTSNTFLPDRSDLSDLSNLSDLSVPVSEEHTSLHLETSWRNGCRSARASSTSRQVLLQHVATIWRLQWHILDGHGHVLRFGFLACVVACPRYATLNIWPNLIENFQHFIWIIPKIKRGQCNLSKTPPRTVL